MKIETGMVNLQAKISKSVGEVGVTNFFLLFVLALITFYPLLFVGITTLDDANIAINFGSDNNLLEMAAFLAEGQGRFSFFWGYPLLRAPYIFDSQFWYLSMKYGSFLLLISALYYAVSRLFRSDWVALASLLFFLTFIQNGWDHNALTSYPLAFNTYAALFLVSLGLYSTAIDRSNLALAGLSALLYFVALGIEVFVLFFPFYVAVLLSRSTSGETVIRRLRAGKKYIFVILLPLITYLTIYLAWRSIHPSTYDGNNLNGFNLLAVGKVVAVYSLSSFPLASLDFIVSHNHPMLFTASGGWHGILSELNASYFIKPAVAGFIFTRLMNTEHFTVPQTKTIICGGALACIGIFLPNLLLGFIQKHQAWVESSYSYLYTYYSFISAVVFAALIFFYMKIKSQSWHPRLRLALILIGVIAIMALSFAVEVRNQCFAFDQKLSHRKWQLMDVFVKSPAFMGMPEGSFVVAPTLATQPRGTAVTPTEYWSRYTKHKTGKNIHFVDDKCIDGAPCYSLVFRQAAHADKQFLVFTKREQPETLTVPNLTVYSLSAQNDAILLGAFKANNKNTEIKANGETITNIGKGLFSINLPPDSDRNHAQVIEIASNVAIYPEQLITSNYNVTPSFQHLQIELGYGFYGWESSPGQPQWAWSKDRSSLKITNYENKTTLVTVKLQLTSLESIKLNISGKSKVSFPVVPGRYNAFEFDIVAPIGTTEIGMQSDHPATSPGNGDYRLLSFAVRELQVVEKTEF